LEEQLGDCEIATFCRHMQGCDSVGLPRDAHEANKQQREARRGAMASESLEAHSRIVDGRPRVEKDPNAPMVFGSYTNHKCCRFVRLRPL
jgi:hypothetical protein